MKKNTWNGAAAVLAAVGGLLAGCSGGGPVEGNMAGVPTGTSAGSGSSQPSTTRPGVSRQPTDAAVLTGDSATFSVAATGTSPTFQWQRDGKPISGATQSTYTVPAVSYRDEGASFTVVLSNKAGSVTSQPAHLHLKLSADQAIFESLIVAPGEGTHELVWNLTASGPQVPRQNYLYTDYAVLADSPLTHGPQRAPQTAPVSLAASVPLPTQPPRRVLKDGAILVVPDSLTTSVVSYEGARVRVDTLADDGQTVAWSQLRSGFSTTDLAGAVASAPDEFVHWFNNLFANADALDPATTFQAGAAYVKYSAVNVDDDYRGFDCHNPSTTGKDLTPCQTSTSLESLLGAGYASASDARTYHLEDGTISTIGGVRVWVASAARPLASTLTATVKYRIYFQVGSSVYTGDLTKADTVLGGSWWASDPSAVTVVEQRTFLKDQIRLNRAARDSIAAAVKF